MNSWIISRRMQRTTKSFGSSSVSLDTRDHYAQAIPTMQVQSTMCRLNGRPVRLHMSSSMSSPPMTPSPVQCMQGTMTSLTNQVGNASRSWLTREKQLLRLVRQAKLLSYKSAPWYKFGYCIPSTFDEALAFDTADGNSKWQDATALEMQQLFSYDCFEDGGIHGEAPNPEGYKKIRVRLCFDVKHDGRHKARYVAGGHLTNVPVESVYSGVVSLRGICIMTFLAELNGLDLWATDVGNAYLEALTSERIYIIAGPEFKELAGRHCTVYALRAYDGTRSLPIACAA